MTKKTLESVFLIRKSEKVDSLVYRAQKMQVSIVNQECFRCINLKKSPALKSFFWWNENTLKAQKDRPTRLEDDKKVETLDWH
jgi:hypothetical protein